MAAPFADRRAAGRALGQKLTHLQSDDVVVVGLPRGGVPVAYEVAEALGAPLDVILVRKLGVPYQPELAMGAIGEDGVRFLDARLVRLTHVTEDELARVEARERLELDRRVQQYRHTTPRLPLAGKTALIVDDGLATGSTARAAIEVARLHGASRVVLAVPLAPVETVESLREVADDVVALATPEPFLAVGNGYRDFRQVGDDEVTEILRNVSLSPRPHEGRESG
jgi:putative phosphoribosyl transferase